MHTLIRSLGALQQQARRLGVFTGERELLTCPGCGLMEDVACSGLLMTYWAKEPGVDSGLRFTEVNAAQGRFKCPSCGAEVTACEVEG